MLLTSPVPFDAALARIRSKTAVATSLTTEQIAQIQIGLRERAFFSARVDDLRVAAAMQSRIDDALSLARRDGGAFMDRTRFIADMRGVLGAAPGDTGDLTDITSARRLGLVYDFNIEDAMEYGRWLARQDPDILDAYPCNELVRVEYRVVPRGFKKGAKGALIEVPEESWPARWERAGGQFYDGRMIALKNDPIWIAISRFGRPWPPFDFMSGMGLADISRQESVEVGAIEPSTPAPAPQELDFNHNLQATVADASPDLLRAFQTIFGATADVGSDGKIVWKGTDAATIDELDAALEQLGQGGDQ